MLISLVFSQLPWEGWWGLFFLGEAIKTQKLSDFLPGERFLKIN